MAFTDLNLTRSNRGGHGSRALRYTTWTDPKSRATKMKLLVPLALLEECAKLMNQPVKGIKLRADVPAGRGLVATLIQADSGGTARDFKRPAKGVTWVAVYPLADDLAALFPPVKGVTELMNATATKMGIEFDLPGRVRRQGIPVRKGCT